MQLVNIICKWSRLVMFGGFAIIIGQLINLLMS